MLIVNIKIWLLMMMMMMVVMTYPACKKREVQIL